MSDAVARLNAALEGRYAIERELGEGGMATVYLADDLKHNRKVALKVLKPELAAVVGAERFLAEIQVTANLQHPNILPLFDSGDADGFLFYVMPYVEGDTLKDRLDREHQLPVGDAVQIATDMAEALDYAHRQGVIHRDIKPGNVLLQAGKPVISDFGIALAVGVAGRGRLTETGLSLGTPHYMSPEQATGDQLVGASTDTYALGSVLYEMLVGEPPYPGTTAQAVLGKIIAGKPVSAMEHRSSVPANVDAAVRCALEKLPADRFGSVQEFVRALEDEHFRYGELVTVAADVGVGPWNRLTMAFAALASLLAVTTLIAGWGWLRPGPEPGVPTRAAVTGVDLVSGGGGWRLAISPDGRTILKVEEGSIHMRTASDPEWRQLPNTEGGFNPTFSPDGQSVAFNLGSGGGIRKVSIIGGPALPVTTSGFSPYWGFDDTIVYSDGDVLYRVGSSGGDPQVLLESDSVGVRRPNLLPNGRAVVFSTEFAQTSRILIFEIETGEVRELVPSGNQPRYVSTGHLIYGHGDGALMGVPFDVETLQVTGAPVTLLPSLAVFGGGASQFAVSQTGTLVYRTGGDEAGPQRQLVFVDREGQEQPLGFEPQNYLFPRFSPEGSRLAVDIVDGADVDLWVFDLDRYSQTRVTFGGNNRFPIWTPAGDRLTHADAVAGTNTLLLTAVDGSGQVDTLLVRDGLQFPTSWSPDGAVVYQDRHPQTDRDLWILPPEGEPEPLVATPANDRDGAFSPDGRWLAYRSDRSGRFEVYVRPYPGPGPEVTVSAGGGSGPVWSRDGSEIFYRTEDQMMAVSIELTDGFRVGAPRVLFEDAYVRSGAANAPNFDIAPDDRRFVMLRTGDEAAGSAETYLVTNWFEELRQRMGN